jgi:ATP-dependent exoDNAse (exonuclease V) alpha subunit
MLGETLLLFSQRLVREYCDDNLLQETTETKVFQQVMQDLMDAQNEDGRDVRDVADEDAALQAAMEEELRYIEQQESNSEQRKVIEAIQNQQTGLCILSGPPGTGKTWLTKKLIHSLRQSGKKVMVTATTGAAATRLSKFASTVHSALAIPLEGSYFPSLSVLSPKRRNIEAADVIIIDEMSMMSRQVFQFVLYRLVQCMGVSDWDGILQNKLIILVGDMHQVSAVQQLVDFKSNYMYTNKLRMQLVCAMCSYLQYATARTFHRTTTAGGATCPVIRLLPSRILLCISSPCQSP